MELLEIGFTFDLTGRPGLPVGTADLSSTPIFVVPLEKNNMIISSRLMVCVTKVSINKFIQFNDELVTILVDFMIIMKISVVFFMVED